MNGMAIYSMKNPLHYQLTEYDCGPTSLLNAVSFLFEREEIPPEVLHNIMLYCLDNYGKEGTPGTSGTSRTAMLFLSNWLDGFGQTGKLPVSSRFITGQSVTMHANGEICDVLRRGGAAVVRLYYEIVHYVLLTGVKDGCVMMFDPYYQEDGFEEKDILVTLDHPFTYNRLVPFSYFNRNSRELYALGDPEERMAVLLFNERTKQTETQTIEYII